MAITRSSARRNARRSTASTTKSTTSANTSTATSTGKAPDKAKIQKGSAADDRARNAYSSTGDASLAQEAYPGLVSPQLNYSYTIARGEQGVLTFEPYKSQLLGLWRFRTAAVAAQSAEALWARFREYGRAGDFVGMDMARKFIQMGMTRAKRYANYAGGRKYDRARGVSGSAGRLSNTPRQKSDGHADKGEKQQASDTFKARWRDCQEDEQYAALRARWVQAKAEWEALDAEEQARREESARKGKTDGEGGDEDGD